LTQAGQIVVDLTNSKQAFIAMRKIVTLIRQGENVMIFPEGARSPDGRLQEFKEGAAMLVLEANKAVVPIAISGSYKVMQRDELYGLRVRTGRVKVTIGTPIRFAEFQDVNLENARIVSAKLREAIERLMHKSL
jgi:1-acyl-sn-glycerol-3-phosphate acyltransferase